MRTKRSEVTRFCLRDAKPKEAVPCSQHTPDEHQLATTEGRGQVVLCWGVTNTQSKQTACVLGV